MLVNYLLPALAVVGSAAAQSSTCTFSSTVTISNQAEATKVSSCKTVKGSVLIGTGAAGAIDISGPKEITGDLSVLDNGLIETLSSDTLTTIGGAFAFKNVTVISTIQFEALKSVQSLSLTTLLRLKTLTFGPLTQADAVTVADTSLEKLDSIDLATVKTLDINNNPQLSTFTSKLGSLSDTFNLNSNGIGAGLTVTLPNLAWIANMTISNVTKFDVPSLKVVNGSARFDSNFFESFTAPNLTHTESGDISFVGNGKLSNLTFPVLKTIGGGLLIANNTKLGEIDAFKNLETVRGAIKLRGSFDEADFSKLNEVNGAFDISSTENITSVCDTLKALSSDGGNGKVAGTFTCTSENEKANEDTDSTTSGDGSVDGSKPNAATGFALNSALFGLVAIAAFASAL
jgi:hypothetical protein